MFISFETLYKTNTIERLDLIVSSPKEAVNLCSLLESHPNVKAWKMTSHKPEEFGMPNVTSTAWLKFRESFTEKDWTESFSGAAKTLKKGSAGILNWKKESDANYPEFVLAQDSAEDSSEFLVVFNGHAGSDALQATEIEWTTKFYT